MNPHEKRLKELEAKAKRSPEEEKEMLDIKKHLEQVNAVKEPTVEPKKMAWQKAKKGTK
jgi:hypothetical protein